MDDGQGDLHLGVDDVDVCFQSMEEEVRIVDDGQGEKLYGKDFLDDRRVKLKMVLLLVT